MAARCELCGKSPRAGKSVSHSHRATVRRFLPNVRVVKVVLRGRSLKMKVCSRCIRSEKIVKAGPRLLAA